MKWQKSLLFLAGSGALLGCVALFGALLTDPTQLRGFWQALTALFWRAVVFFLPTDTLAPATWWTICAVAVIDVLYLLWVYGQRRGRVYHVSGLEISLNGASLSARRYLSAAAYETLLRQRHATLLARYQDPGLVQFLLNREAARAQRLEQWFAVGEKWASVETYPTSTPSLVSEGETQRWVERSALVMLTKPIGV